MTVYQYILRHGVLEKLVQHRSNSKSHAGRVPSIASFRSFVHCIAETQH